MNAHVIKSWLNQIKIRYVCYAHVGLLRVVPSPDKHYMGYSYIKIQ